MHTKNAHPKQASRTPLPRRHVRQARRFLCLCLIAWLIGMLSPDIPQPHGAHAASSWSPTLLVNTEAFQQIDSGDSTTNIELRFGTSTQTLTYLTSGKFQLTSGLGVQGNLSGNTLRVDGNADVWGGLSATGAIKSKSTLTLNSDNDTNDAILTFGNQTAAQTLKFLNTAQQFQFSKGVSVQGSLSGATLRVDRNADVWGTLGVSGATVLNRVSYLWPATPAASSGKVLKVNPATGQLSWSADQTGGGGPAGNDTYVQFNDGGSALGGDAVFRWDKTLDVLTVAGTASGRVVRAQDLLAVSGSLVVRPGTTGQPTLFANGTSKVGINTASPETALEVAGAMSGRTLTLLPNGSTVGLNVAGTASGRLIHAQDRLESSGSLVVNSNTAFNKVNYLWPASPAAASGYTLKVNPTNGKMSWSASGLQATTYGSTGFPNCGAGTGYLGFHGPANCNTTEASVETTFQTEGSVRVTGFTCVQLTDGSCTMRATLRKNRGYAVNGDLKCTITNQSSCGDTGTATYANGDEISIALNDTGGTCSDTAGVTCNVYIEW